MSIDSEIQTAGFAQEIPAGSCFEIGNDWLQRRIHCISGRIATTSLVNADPRRGVPRGDHRRVRDRDHGRGPARHARLQGLQVHRLRDPATGTTEARTLEIKLETDLNETPLRVSRVLRGCARATTSSASGSRSRPCELEGWAIRSVTIENMRFKEMVEGVVPQPRYLRQYDNHEDRVHSRAGQGEHRGAEPAVHVRRPVARSVVTYLGLRRGAVLLHGVAAGRGGLPPADRARDEAARLRPAHRGPDHRRRR